MKYDANERCFSLTISTEDEKYQTSHFRFVANHSAEQNWGETDDNVKNKTGLARPIYDGEDDDNHSCMAGDPNDVQHRTTARENEADCNERDILWNRPAGIWRIKFTLRSTSKKGCILLHHIRNKSRQDAFQLLRRKIYPYIQQQCCNGTRKRQCEGVCGI